MDGYDEYEDLRPSKHAGVKRLSDEITCEICEGVLRDPATLPCCHTFCLACVEDKLQGHGVYESKCPRCGMPLHFKDLRVNQSYNGVIEQIESARARFSVLERENREERDSPGPTRPGLVPARTPEMGTREPPVPSTARCREIARDVRHIDAALAFLAARLEKATGDAADAADAADAPRRARRETRKSPSEKGVAARTRRPPRRFPARRPSTSATVTQNTDPNATGPETLNRSLATPRGARRESPTRNRAASDSTRLDSRDAAGTSPVANFVCEMSRVRSLTAPQARRLYAAAHGKPPPKRLAHALKKLHAELEKLDAGLVEQLIEIVLRDERDAAFPAEADSSPREPRGEASSVGRNDGRRVSEPAPRLEPEPEPELARTKESPEKISRVFAYAYAAPSASSRGESLGGVRGRKSRRSPRPARVNDATAAEASANRTATAADPAEGFPARDAPAGGHERRRGRNDADDDEFENENENARALSHGEVPGGGGARRVGASFFVPGPVRGGAAVAPRTGLRARRRGARGPGRGRELDRAGPGRRRKARRGLGEVRRLRRRPGGRPRARGARRRVPPARWSRCPRRRACWSRRWSDCCARAAEAVLARVPGALARSRRRRRRRREFRRKKFSNPCPTRRRTPRRRRGGSGGRRARRRWWTAATGPASPWAGAGRARDGLALGVPFPGVPRRCPRRSTRWSSARNRVYAQRT